MSWRLGDLVISGEIINTTNYSTHGYLTLRGVDEPILLQLTGNCDPDLAGRHMRFEVRPRPTQDADSPATGTDSDDNAVPDITGLARQQIGPTGTMTANHRVKVADCSIHELIMRCKLGEPPPMQWKRCLYLEWYSQNGRVLVEIPDPIVEFVGEDETEPMDTEPTANESDPDDWEHDANTDDADPDDASHGLSITDIRFDEDGNADIRDVTPDDVQGCGECDCGRGDPYGLISADLQRELDAQSRELDRAIRGDTDAEDPDFSRELELMDDCIAKDDSEPVGTLFDAPIKMPPPDTLDDKEVESHLKILLGQMALYGVALDVCEHFTPRDCYRLLIEEICLNQSAYPRLRGTRWVQHFMTSEYCDTCEQELERQFEEERRQRGPSEDKDEPT